jgi:hypothetical protein
VNRDFKDLLAGFDARGVEYLVVGAHALAAHGHVRATKDLDVWVRPDADNASRVLNALAAFGAPLQDLTQKDLTTPGLVFQIGVAPVRIDVMTSVTGIMFEDAWRERFVARLSDQDVPVLSRKHLIANKNATGRTQDRADVEALERLGNPQGSA